MAVFMSKKEQITCREEPKKESEKYAIKKAYGLYVAPILLSIGFAVFGGWMYYTEKNESLLVLFIPLLIIGGMLKFLMHLSEEWEVALKCKEKLCSENADYDCSEGYESEKIYTDFAWEAYLFKAFHILLWLLNILLIGVALYFVYHSWSGIYSTITIKDLLAIITLLLFLIFIKMK